MELSFRRLTKKDLPFLLEIRNDCRSFLHNDNEFDLASAEKWFEESKPDFRLILLNNDPIGYFRLSNYEAEEGSIYIGADIHAEARGKGLGLKAYQVFIPLLQKEYSLNAIKLEVLSHNTRAIHLYEKLGFKQTKVVNNIMMRDGCTIDNIFMTLELS